MLLVISIMRGGASGAMSVEGSHATALSAIVGGIVEALFTPISLLLILVAFGAAFWVVRRPT